MRRAALAAAGALLVLAGARAEAGASGPVSSRALLAKLRASGRAEAAVELRRDDPLRGGTAVVRGRLVLELPRFARLELEDGQRLTLRADGGDWLQPAARQLVRAGRRTAAGALVWWGALLDPLGTGVRERQYGERRYRLTLPGDGATAEQRVELGPGWLPRSLVAGDGVERVEYRLSRWRFARARGPAEFTLRAPAGFEVVELP